MKTTFGFCAARFAARLGFAIEPATAQAIRAHSAQLVRISPERIADELRLMLTPPTRSAAYALLNDLGMRRLIFRFLDLPTCPGGVAGDVSVFNTLAAGQSIPFGLALAGATVDQVNWHGPADADIRRLFQKPTIQKIVRAMRQSLKISNEESDDLQGTFEGLEPLLGPDFPSVARLKRFLARPTAMLSRQLLAAMNHIGQLDAERVRSLTRRLSELEQTPFAPTPLISGDDLTAAGLTPGPMFKRVLDTVYDAQLEDRVTTRDEALALALRPQGSKVK